MPIININDLKKNNFKLAASNYQKVNVNLTKLEEITKYIDRIEKGVEVGSQEYVDNSEFKFLRTAAFNEKAFSLKIDHNSLIDITPKAFVDNYLKKDDILICKDSNVGEVSILNEDMNKTMYSSGINKIVFKEHSKYYFAIMKNANFKNQLDKMIPKGSTIKHAKDLYLKCKVPIVKNEEIIKYIEDLVDIIIKKESYIRRKKQIIDEYIQNEIDTNQSKEDYIYKYPTINDIRKVNRLDTGNYTNDFKELEYKIKNYKRGFFYIEEENIKGGNTPKDRYIDKRKDLKFLWIIPTLINDDGTFYKELRISCEKNNINENCCLIINRTSKGGIGEYVGITSFYNYEENGKAQHNQGIYKISNYSDKKLVFITCLLNNPIYRQICANLSMGSKMKELKLKNFLQIPFPNFEEKDIDFIYKLYTEKTKKKITNKDKFRKDNEDNKCGILEIYKSMNSAKQKLDDIVNKLYNEESIEIKYEVF